MGVSKNSGTPKWMVKIMVNPIKMDDLGVPLFLETPIYIYTVYISTTLQKKESSTIQPKYFVAGHRKGLLNSLRRSSNAAVPLSINSWKQSKELGWL